MFWLRIISSLIVTNFMAMNFVSPAMATSKIPASIATTAVIDIAEYEQERIYGELDHDWYRVFLTKGASYRFHLKRKGDQGESPDPFLTLRGPTGLLISMIEDFNSYTNGSVITFKAPSTGPYYLDVGMHRASRYGTTYVLRATFKPPQPICAAPTRLLTAGVPLYGTIGTTVRSISYCVGLAKGQTLWVDIDSRSGTNPLTSRSWSLRNGAGKQLTSGSGDIYTEVPEAGTYYITVSGRFDTGDFTILYVE